MNDWPINGLSIKLPAVLPAIGALEAHNSESIQVMENRLNEYIALGGQAVMTGSDAGDETIRLLGRCIKRMAGGREGLLWIGMGSGEDDAGPRMRKTVLERRLLHSLELADTGVMDLYLLEGDDPNVHVGYILEGMNALLQKGYCRAFGAHGWSMERLREAARHAERTGVKGFSCVSLALDTEYAAGLKRIEEPDEAWLAEHKLPVLLQARPASGEVSRRLQELAGGEDANESAKLDKQGETLLTDTWLDEMLRPPYTAAVAVPALSGQAADIVKAARERT
ncbi:aldo/keto reductase [Paenibacillus tarimensis]|uniref:aldo/keto reductase n=1 Tax=Paenibacillus tarimensis TaxID=416012 RepID=UPI001F374E79|nr:aldo/keto reductase [Paenibacillus tarimensis]MCF2943568.1 aldo/keto reductase [Paenibacillus tarimensis]